MKIAHIVIVPLLLLGSCAEDANKVVDMRDPQSIKEDKTDVSEGSGPAPTEEPSSHVSTKSNWTYKVMLVSEGNWGYQLFDAGKMVINQTSIPAVQGILGFDTKEKADKTARFILEKINRGEFPPTISQEELKTLNVLRAEN
jgi:hypothetical protein